MKMVFNELNTNEFKKFDVSTSVIMNQQVKNPRDLASIKSFRRTLIIVYYLKAQLVKSSLQVKTARAQKRMQFDLVEVFSLDDEESGAKDDDVLKANVFFAPRLDREKAKKTKVSTEESPS
ncbi:hypothetical protein INT48_001077 [Thamnidium elegans]|uniref:Uncharacterized protein n=1 Tax=Thamnidium elegans TaxID=101142 RepID=A0A8H7SL59_9FUNG|nr:hypothetical protein INT48_001077 [Thamnidium elegans]